MTDIMRNAFLKLDRDKRQDAATALVVSALSAAALYVASMQRTSKRPQTHREGERTAVDVRVHQTCPEANQIS